MTLPPQARLAPLCLLLAVGLSTACTHSMEIRNRDSFRTLARTETSVRVLIERNLSSGESGLALAQALHTGLLGHASVERVVFSDLAPDDFEPDYVVELETRTEYHGSGLNYWITFPGFLVFAHAWNGMAYEADVQTRLSVRHASADAADRRQLETKYDLRHTTFLRGALVSSGWYTPFYGGLNAIMGFFMLPYDNSATQPFLREVQDPYGSYVANNVIEMIKGQEHELAKANPPEPEETLAETTEGIAEIEPETLAAGSAEVEVVEGPAPVGAGPPESASGDTGPVEPAVRTEAEAQPSF